MTCRPWENLSLRMKGLFPVAIYAGVIVLALWAHAITLQTAAGEQRVVHSLRTKEEIRSVRIAVAEMGSAMRAYLISTDEVYARKTREAIATVDTATQALSHLVSGDTAHTQRLRRIEAVQRSRVERIYGDIARKQGDALSPAEARANLFAAETERAQVRSFLEEMQDQEESVFQEAVQRLNSFHRERTMVNAGIIVLAVVGVAVVVLFSCGISRRILTLKKTIENLVLCGVLDALPDRRDEIGALSSGIARLAVILNRKSSALDCALHGIAQADGFNRCVSHNKAYAELACMAEGGGSVNIQENVHPDDVGNVENAITTMRATGHAETEVRIIHKQGPFSEVSMTLILIPDDPEAAYHVFLSDGTLRRESEAALVLARDAAIASSQTKSRFLAKISHDIRTPLNAILGAADLLSETRLDKNQSEYVRMFQRNCRRLVGLINDFLDFSRIEAGAIKIEKSSCNVREIVADAVATFREVSFRKGLKLHFEVDDAVPQWIITDSARIHQILVNLISNAIKFTLTGGVDVWVHGTGTPDSGRVRLAVHDTGPGIAEQHQTEIFAPFAQLPTEDASQRGSGLGLTICRELVERMEGEMGLVSRVGEGSTFHFTLPFDSADGVAASGTRAESVCIGRCRDEPAKILAVEDTADNRILLQHYLRNQPVHLQFAINGQEALEICKRLEFDLILMDIDLPGLDGFATTKLIRSWQAENLRTATPVVALSAHAMQETVRASLEAGCVAHVAKPVERSVLLNTIRRYALSKSVRPQCPPETCIATAGIESLVPVYLASKPRQIEEALASLKRSDFDAIRRFGHNLKGTGVAYGFPRIKEIGSAIENAVSTGDEADIRGQLEALYRFVTQLAVAGKLETGDNTSEGMADEFVLRPT